MNMPRGHGSVPPPPLWRRAGIIGAVCVIALLLCMCSPVAAESGNVAAHARLPAADFYPAGTSLTYLPSASNRVIDCDWGFVCDPHGIRHEPLFHTLTQDQLHRRDGWVQFGMRRQGALVTQFVLVVSHYGTRGGGQGRQWSARALANLDTATWLAGYRSLVHAIPLGSVCRGVVEKRWSFGVTAALLLGCRTDSSEIEAVVSADRPSVEDRCLDRRDLVRQLEAAAETEGTAHSR